MRPYLRLITPDTQPCSRAAKGSIGQPGQRGAVQGDEAACWESSPIERNLRIVPDGPPKKPSGMFRMVQDHLRRASEILQRCGHEHRDGRVCHREVGHDGVHRDHERFEWEDAEGRWR